MPIDPNTGNRLPYKGEPGYDEAKKKFPDLYAAEEAGEMQEMAGDEGPEDASMDMAPEEIVPNRDLKPAMDKADEMMKAEEGMADDKPMEEGMEKADDMSAMDDMEAKPLMETLGMSQERAEEIMMAAKSIPQYADMNADELADLLSRDFQVLMELERTAASMAKPQEDPQDMMGAGPMMEPEMPMA